MKKIIFGLVLLAAVAAATVAQSSDTTASGGAGSSSTSSVDWSDIQSSASAQAAVYSAQGAAYAEQAQAYSAQSAMYAAQHAAQVEAVGSVTSQSAISNDVTTTSVSASADAKLLASLETQRATDDAATDLKAVLSASGNAPASAPIILVSNPSELAQSESLHFDQESTDLTASFSVADGYYLSAEAANCAATNCAAAQHHSIAAESLNFTGIGATFQAVAGLASYFNATYGYSSLSIGDLDTPATVYMANSLRCLSGHARYLASDVVASDMGIIAPKFGPLQTSYIKTIAEDVVAKENSVALKKLNTPVALAAAEKYDLADSALGKSISSFESFVGWLDTVPAQGTVANIVNVVREKQLGKIGNPLMLTVSAKPVAANYTKKDIWTIFTGPPLYVMGGVVVNYRLTDPGTGQLYASGVVNRSSGYDELLDSSNRFEEPNSKTAHPPELSKACS